MNQLQRICAIASFVWIGFTAFESLGQAPLDRDYGRGRGQGYQSSVNGTSVFAEMFQSSGRNVTFDRRVSRRTNKFETAVWFPDSFDPPSDDVTERLEQWLISGQNRVLIFVERDFDAEIPYWEAALKKAVPADAAKIRRHLATIRKAHESRRKASQFQDRQSCNWYKIEKRMPTSRCTTLAGSWSRLVDVNKSEIYITSDFTIPNSNWYQFRTLLSGNGEPLITEITFKFNGGKIYFVHNGSMLLNLPLVNSENRAIASNLIDQCSYGDVVFLESDYDGLLVSQRDGNAAQTPWQWVAKKPLCYIVPHFVLLGIIFCFASFPIFGRPKKLKKESTSDFSGHIKATAKLLRRANNQQLARQKVQQWHELQNRTET